MAIQLDHTIVPARDKVASTTFFARIFGLEYTIATSGIVTHKALKAAETLEADGIAAEVIDLRTSFPLDTQTILE